MKIVISSGHGKHVRGASHPDGLDEVNEARRVVPKVVEFLQAGGHEVIEYHDDVSTTQDENLKRITKFHNAQGNHDLDVSVHFNAYQWTDGGRGTEVLYVTQDVMATDIAAAISRAGGLINRGAHKRTDLYFLNKTYEPSVLRSVFRRCCRRCRGIPRQVCCDLCGDRRRDRAGSGQCRELSGGRYHRQGELVWRR